MRWSELTESERAGWVGAVWERVERSAWMAVGGVVMALACAVGVAVGNGIPMAKTSSEAIRTGIQIGIRQGLDQCPCKGALAAKAGVSGPVPPATAAGQTLSKAADGSWLVDGKPLALAPVVDTAVKTALFEGAKDVQPVGPTPLVDPPKKE